MAHICRQVGFQTINIRSRHINPPSQQAMLASLCYGGDGPCETSSMEQHSRMWESSVQPASQMEKRRGRDPGRQDDFLLPSSLVKLNYFSFLPSSNRSVWRNGGLSEVLYWWSSLLRDGNTKRGDEALQTAHSNNDITYPSNNNKMTVLYLHHLHDASQSVDIQ